MKKAFICSLLTFCFSYLALSQQESNYSPYAISFGLRPEFSLKNTWISPYIYFNNFNLSLLKFTKPGHLLEYELTELSFGTRQLLGQNVSSTLLGAGVNYYFMFRKDKRIVPVIGPSANLFYNGFKQKSNDSNSFPSSGQHLVARLNTVFGIFINPEKRFFYKITVPVNIIGIELEKSKNGNPSIPINHRNQSRMDSFLLDDGKFITAINLGVGMRISSK